MCSLLFVILTCSFANIPLKNIDRRRKMMMIKDEIESYSKKNTNEYRLLLRLNILPGNRFYCKWIRRKTSKNQHSTHSTRQQVNVSDVLQSVFNGPKEKEKGKEATKNLIFFFLSRLSCSVNNEPSSFFFSRPLSSLKYT
jgi:hypothetical protein